MDECSTNIAITRLYARAPKGERAFGQTPRNWGKNVSLICSLSANGIGAAMSVEGAADGVAFKTYVKHFLHPTLKRGQIVVMDNLQVHKTKRARDLIEGAGAEVLFLPPYSPDFSPIEEAFSEVKGILRRVGARTLEALLEAISEALDAVSSRDARGWFGIATTIFSIVRYENRSRYSSCFAFSICSRRMNRAATFLAVGEAPAMKPLLQRVALMVDDESSSSNEGILGRSQGEDSRGCKRRGVEGGGCSHLQGGRYLRQTLRSSCAAGRVAGAEQSPW